MKKAGPAGPAFFLLYEVLDTGCFTAIGIFHIEILDL